MSTTVSCGLGMNEDEADEIIRIGFLNESVSERLPQYQELYDAVIINDGTFEFPNALLAEILQEPLAGHSIDESKDQSHPHSTASATSHSHKVAMQVDVTAAQRANATKSPDSVSHPAGRSLHLADGLQVPRLAGTSPHGDSHRAGSTTPQSPCPRSPIVTLQIGQKPRRPSVRNVVGPSRTPVTSSAKSPS